MLGIEPQDGAQSGPVDAWRSISLLVLQHGQQNCDLTVRTMRHISDERLTDRQMTLFNEALSALGRQLEEQHLRLQAVISGLKIDP